MAIELRLLMIALYLALPVAFVAMLAWRQGRNRSLGSATILATIAIVALMLNQIWGQLAYQAYVASNRPTAAGIAHLGLAFRTALILLVAWLIARDPARGASANDR